MISFFKVWCENILIAVFISMLIEMLVPSGNIKKYVKVIIGVYIVFVILNPIVSKLKNIEFEEFFNEILENNVYIGEEND